MKKRIHFGLLFLLLPCFLWVCGCSQKKAIPQARKGVLDLRTWDFKRDGLVELKGEWELYWHKLLTPEDFNGPVAPLKTGFTKVPSYWEGQRVNGTRLHYQGYATLRLLISMSSDPPPVVIDYFRIAGSRNIWFNGHLLGGNQIPDLPRSGDRNSSGTAVTHYVNAPGRIQELIIQLDNSDMNVAYGAHFSIVFGPLKAIQHHRLIRTGIDLFIISACILIGFYHLVLFFFRTAERALLYFSCGCLLLGMIVLFAGTSRPFWLFTLWPQLTWPVYISVGYTIYFTAILSFLLFIHSLFPRESSLTIMHIGMTLCGFWVVAGLILPFSSGVPYLQALMRLLFYPTVRPSEITTIMLSVYIIVVILLAARRKRPGSYIVAAGMLIFIFMAAFDILMLLTNPGVIRLEGIGFIALLISQALMLARQFSQSFTEVARLSETLKEKNIALSRLDQTDGACQVLIVDDDLVNLQVVASHLALENISFNTAADGPAAIRLIEADGPPDIILLDIMMPKMTGYQVSRTLRTTYSPSELPIIMLTAKNRMADLVAGFEAGANDYLTKPFSKDELLVRVRSQLKLKKAYQTLAENVRLKKELAQRRQTELDLRLMQRRLSQLLDTVEDMVITVNESREIAFCNATANSLLGFEIETLLGQSLRLLFDDSFSETLDTLLKRQLQREADAAMARSYPQVNITAADGSRLKVHIIATPLNLDEERLQALIIRQPEPPTAATVGAASQTALVVIDELNRHQERLHGLEETLNGLLPRLTTRAPEVLGEIRALDQALAAVEQNLLSGDSAIDRRQLAVMVMQLSLDYWYEATGLDKVELARESGIWKVYTNQDGWTRTQTLDKYLHTDTLPRRPRWKLIHNTAVYVLAACMTPSPLRDRLEQTLARLRLAGRSKE